MMLKNQLNIIWIMVIALLVSSCEKDEIPVTREVGELSSDVVSIGTNYSLQVYYDLETQSIVKSNERGIWDIAFDCRDNGNNIIINNAKFTQVYHTGVFDFDQMIENPAPETPWKWDNPNGNLDETAIGNWTVAGSENESKNEIYLIDRGYSPEGEVLGYKKLQINSLINGEYQFKIADLDGSNLVEKSVIKDSEYNFIFINLDDGLSIEIEPKKEDWDLMFSSYTHVYEDFEDGEDLGYLVTGILLNRYNTQSANDSIIGFDNINIDNTLDINLVSDINNIGFDWKFYNFDTGQFEIVDNTYVIKDSHGLYYKLRFIDFYNDLGEKGNPAFELQRL